MVPRRISVVSPHYRSILDKNEYACLVERSVSLMALIVACSITYLFLLAYPDLRLPGRTMTFFPPCIDHGALLSLCSGYIMHIGTLLSRSERVSQNVMRATLIMFFFELFGVSRKNSLLVEQTN